METYGLGPMELRFAELIWEREPIPSGELVKLCKEQMKWQKSTTYTILCANQYENLKKNLDAQANDLSLRAGRNTTPAAANIL